MNAEEQSPPQTQPRRRTLSRLLTAFLLASLLIRVVVYGGDSLDIVLVAIIATFAVVPYLISRHRRNQDRHLSAHRLKRSTTGNEREPLKGVFHRNLVRIEGNWIKRCEGMPGRLARLLRRRSQVIGFATENERVELTLSWDGRVTLSDGSLSRHDIDLRGPQEQMLVLLENAQDIRSIPDSIMVRVRGRDPPLEADYAVRDGIAKTLRTLFR